MNRTETGRDSSAASSSSRIVLTDNNRHLRYRFGTFVLDTSRGVLLENDTEPDDETIREALSGNICRCTGYHRIIEAVKWAAAMQRGDDWRPDEALFMGHEVPGQR